MSKLLTLLLLITLTPTLGAPTLSYQITQFLNDECPEECPALNHKVSAEDFKACRDKLEATAWENCSFKGVMSLSGTNATRPCIYANDAATVSRLDLSVNEIMSIPDLADGSTVTLTLQNALKEGCDWWIARTEKESKDTCNVDLNTLKFDVPANLTAPAGATNVAVPMARLTTLALAAKGKRAECADFDSVDYSKIKWNFSLSPPDPSPNSCEYILAASLNIAVLIYMTSIH